MGDGKQISFNPICKEREIIYPPKLLLEALIYPRDVLFLAQNATEPGWESPNLLGTQPDKGEKPFGRLLNPASALSAPASQGRYPNCPAAIDHTGFPGIPRAPNQESLATHELQFPSFLGRKTIKISRGF
jgi:hypothetical protein